LQTIAGYDPEDPYSASVPVDDYLANLESGVKGWHVAFASGDYFSDAKVVDSAVMAAFHTVASAFEQLGAHVDLTSQWNLSDMCRSAALANGLMVTSDAAVFHKERLEVNPQGFGQDVLTRLQQGATCTMTDYIKARHSQVLLRRKFELFFQEYDLLLTPTTPITAPLRGSADAVERARLLTRFTAPFNLVGLPAISLPCGVDNQGMPIGIQLIARSWAEASLLRAANAFQNATHWHQLTPM
jgi:aspartyl-tRNA(Asn)/glutamyl-tRNA(Gln) amidotransferase subunit A